MVDDQIVKKFGNRVRVRVCGICWRNDELLMISQLGLTSEKFWSPPGGGLEFGDKARERLKSEFLEETGILIQPGRQLFVCEFKNGPLHAIEIFFETKYLAGELKVGKDPELEDYHQIINGVRFMKSSEIMALGPHQRHGIFNLVDSANEVNNLAGFYSI